MSQTSNDQDLVMLQQTLLGMGSKATVAMKEAIDLSLKIVIELNAQINYTQTLRIMLGDKSEDRRLNAKLTAINSGLTEQNQVLMKIREELVKQSLVSGTRLTDTEKNLAVSVCDKLDAKIGAMVEDNQRLLQEVAKQKSDALGKVAAKGSEAPSNDAPTTRPKR